jgi:membrane protease YdiL (CAAX protease family)
MSARPPAWVPLVLLGPFYLNDFANLHIHDWRLWLLIDYLGVKLLPLLVVAWLLRSRRMRPAEFGLRAQPPLAALITFLSVTLIGTVIDQNGGRWLAAVPGFPALGGMPEITSSFWNGLDLSLGLLLVGICEELVFRGYLHTLLRRFTRKRWLILLLSSVVFGLIHWSLGFHAILTTALIGAVFMGAYLITAALPAIMLAHFAINFIDFAGVVPKELFRLGG